MPDAPSPAPAPNTTDISPAQGDKLVEAMEAAQVGESKAADSDIAADDVGATAMAEQMNKPKPSPLG